MVGPWERLSSLRAIVDTARADDLEREAEAVRSRYELYAETYFVTEPVSRIEERLIHDLGAGRSVVGYLSGDFGYGKTATAIYLWKRCLDCGMVAVPPFLFRRLRDVALATNGWLAYQLRHSQPSLLPRLEATYHAHMSRSIEELAKQMAASQGLAVAKARAIVEEYIVPQRDVTSTQSLLDFLREQVALARQAGFKGLVVFADESQEFIRAEEAGARDAIQTLSELVKGVRSMVNVPLGVIFLMPVNPTETAIEEQAGDIMHRMRERGTALRLQDAYGREFPKRLWDQVCACLGDESARRAIDPRTLEAIGQLCERKDLSNGPRTVVTALKCGIHRYRDRQRPYTPIDLIDDYLEGHIVFEGRDAKVTATLRTLLGLPAIQGNPRREQAVKLLAAFPRGVDRATAGELYDVLEDLAERGQWLGEYITQLAEGYALVRLQERVEARPLAEEIIRDFRNRWHSMWDQGKKTELATSGFIREIVPLLFPQRLPGQYVSFGGHKDLRSDARGVAYVVLEGCFEELFSRFPNRRVCVSASSNTGDLALFSPPDEDTHLDFRFFLELPEQRGMDSTPVRIVTANRDRRVDWHLNLGRAFGRQFPTDLVLLHDIMSPERTSAEVLLALSMWMAEWLKEHPETGQADRGMIEALRRTLHRHCVQLLLPDAGTTGTVETEGIRVLGAETRLIESAFQAKSTELYPEYKPLFITKEWRNYLRRYREVLAKRSLAERRGHKPYGGSKDEISRAFGWTNTAFEANSRILQDMLLLRVHWAKGRGEDGQASVLFLEHPLEQSLRQTLQRDGKERTVPIMGTRMRTVRSIHVTQLREVAARLGYLQEELDEVLELLVLRQYVERTPDGTVHESVSAPDATELGHQADELETRLRLLLPHCSDGLRTHVEMLEEARHYLGRTDDEVALDAAQRALLELVARLDEFAKGRARELAISLDALEADVERRVGELTPRELEQQVSGTVGFVGHVDDQRKDLQKRFALLRQKWTELGHRSHQVKEVAKGSPDERRLAEALDEYNRLRAAGKVLEEEEQDLRPYLTGLQHWREVVMRASALRDRLDRDSTLRQRLDGDVANSIMEDFARRQLEVLLDWERFKAGIDAIEAEANAEEARKRDEFNQRKERYEQVLGRFTGQRMLQAIFDPKDPDQSFQLLCEGVLRKLRDWLDEQREVTQKARSEIDYLVDERGIRADSERLLAERVTQTLIALTQELSSRLVGEWPDFEKWCRALEDAHEKIRGLLEQLSKTRMQKEPPTEDENRVLQLLTIQRCGLEDLRRRLGAKGLSLHDLFESLRSLYRKGHVEIEVRKRE